jgi:signal transduction histidine kinase
MVTHELRTPLTSIRAFSEILQADPMLDLDKRRQFIGIIVKESERLTRLINQVLDLAKLESGTAEWHSTELDLREVIEEAVSATSTLVQERGAELTTELPRGLPTVRADRDRLMQVLINLIANAVKFCDRQRGRIHIQLCSHGDGALRVDVRDNGIGIAPADQHTIFEKFHQVGDTLTDKPQGTGLGLPISRQIVQHFGGTLWVESALGQGSTFSFTLPLDARARAGATIAATREIAS